MTSAAPAERGNTAGWTASPLAESETLRVAHHLSNYQIPSLRYQVRPKQPSENWVACLWDYICTSGRGGGGSSGDRGRREQKDPAETMRLFERAWPLLPATGGVGSDAIRVLLEVHSGMPVVSPLSDSMRARGMGDDMKKVGQPCRCVVCRPRGRRMVFGCVECVGRGRRAIRGAPFYLNFALPALSPPFVPRCSPS